MPFDFLNLLSVHPPFKITQSSSVRCSFLDGRTACIGKSRYIKRCMGLFGSHYFQMCNHFPIRTPDTPFRSVRYIILVARHFYYILNVHIIRMTNGWKSFRNEKTKLKSVPPKQIWHSTTTNHHHHHHHSQMMFNLMVQPTTEMIPKPRPWTPIDTGLTLHCCPIIGGNAFFKSCFQRIYLLLFLVFFLPGKTILTVDVRRCNAFLDKGNTLDDVVDNEHGGQQFPTHQVSQEKQKHTKHWSLHVHWKYQHVAQRDAFHTNEP